MYWVLKWGSRVIGVMLCATSWMIAAGLASLGGDWFSDTFMVHSIDDLIAHGIVTYGGETIGAAFFFFGGIVLLWAFWRRA